MARTPNSDKYRNIEVIIEKYIKENPGIKSASKIARMILEKENISYYPEHLAVKIRKFRIDNNLLEKINTQTEDTDAERYSVYDDAYHWKTKKLGNYQIPVELADRLFYEYSRHGLNMSQITIRQKHNISIQEWHSIKSTLWLYKDSNIFSPWTVEHTPDHELQDMIQKKMEMKFNDKNRLVEEEYDKALQNQYKKVIKNESVKTFALEKMIDELYDLTAKMTEINVLTINKTDGPHSIGDLVVPIADLHIGAKVEGLRLTPEFDTAILRRRLGEVAKAINQKNAARVHLQFLGDLIESFTGLNHINSWQSIEQGVFGAKVVILALEIIEEFISKVNNVCSVVGISGNHDRVSSNNKEDVRGQVAEIIFYMLKRMYGDKFDMDYDTLVISKRIDGINYIIAHGDKNVIKQDGKQAIIDYGDSTIYNLILSGHLHTRMIKEDQKTYRWILCPSIFTGNFYSESNGWQTTAGVLLIYNSGTGLPIIEDVSLR